MIQVRHHKCHVKVLHTVGFVLFAFSTLTVVKVCINNLRLCNSIEGFYG